MAFSLRLPPALEADARARCERLGVSLNALVCVALDAYLRAAPPVAPADSQALTLPPAPAPAPLDVPSTAPATTRKKPVLTAPPLPVPAPPPISRAERRRLEREAQKAKK